ncbi:WXG100 family type VII secretion target [Solwaraspora sp. WMMD791]|jgi:WXG100 family type VII secretion target|uniref:WXG100 family type VII secretion target n=1 Tax=unclassified Solwaraspora TaxID=2627926 RepID=UPI00249AD19E|nr:MULTISPECIES: WXG100 family type VII secretion target [unclassified Solwaraspora]WFE30098.1 WXG100 family type VII secretion target [Solwaraspora sp. WMMD791]WJK43061.1 WXG100 family type VII secretion target [Solwaraspora sp. WMMA2056]
MANVNVTYQEMRDAANRLTRGKEEIMSKLVELRSMVNNLVNGGYVTDSSSKQFDESYTEFNEGATKMAEGLEGMGKYLTAAADTFQQADEELAKALRK